MKTAQELTQEANKFHDVIFFFSLFIRNVVWKLLTRERDSPYFSSSCELVFYNTLWLVVSSTIFRIASNVADRRSLYVVCLSWKHLFWLSNLNLIWLDAVKKEKKKSFYLQTWHLSCYNLIQILSTSQPFAHPWPPPPMEWGGESATKLNL